MAGLTVIYVDTLFLLNAIVDYLLLLCSARLAGERLSRLRFALGALHITGRPCPAGTDDMWR